MQKKLIVAAVAAAVAAPAFAQSAVTISGTIRMGVESFDHDAYSSEMRVSDQNSEIVFSGTEDLGGGLKAFFRIASRLSNDAAPDARNTGINGWSLGNSGVGLETQFGKFTIGRWDLHYNNLTGNLEGGAGGYRVTSLQGLAGHGIMSQVQGGTMARGTRSNNVMMYDSPNWSGFSGTLAYSTNPAGNEGCVQSLADAANAQGCNQTAAGVAAPGGDTNPSKNGAVNVVLKYANGPINVGYSYWKWDHEGGNAYAGTDERGDSVWGAYSFSGFRIGLGWNKSEFTRNTGGAANVSTTIERDAWMIPVSYTMGNHGFYFTYAWADDASGSVAQGLGGTGSNTGAKWWKLAYDYALSKRTSVGISYTDLNNDDCATYQLFNVGNGVNGASTGPGLTNGSTNSCGVGGVATPAGARAADQSQWYFGVQHSF